LAIVQQGWSQVLEHVRARDKSVQALLNSTRPADVQDEVVTLHVAHEFARNKLSEGRARQLVEEVMSQVFQHNCQVTLTVVPMDSDDPSVSVNNDPPEPDASDTGASANMAPSQPGNSLDSDPLVQEMKKMGAEVRFIPEGSEK
jgi:hypothetical protein